MPEKKLKSGRKAAPVDARRVADLLTRVSNGEDVSGELDVAIDEAVHQAYVAQRRYVTYGFAPVVKPSTIVAKNIKALREEAGWSQARLSAAMDRLGFGWSRVTAAQVETEVRRLSFEELFALAGLFGVPVAELLVQDTMWMQLNDDGEVLMSGFARELVIGQGGRIGTGGPTWQPALLAGRDASKNHERPALELWRRRRASRSRATKE